MKYVELTIEEAMQRCDKNAKVLVAIQDLKDTKANVSFVKKNGKNIRKFLKIYKQPLRCVMILLNN